jgi:thiol-disulfide isomerase/thioredoxin
LLLKLTKGNSYSSKKSSKMLQIKKILGAVVLLLLFTQVNSQDEVTLHIGDPAPELKYSKWLKGTPITSFKGDQLYILEFWATWCGPCKGAMPHLTKLQKEYEGKATIIGVGVWEKIKEGQPYESSLLMVTKYVQGNNDNMGYSVIADNNDQYMGDNWLKAAGQGGIPATFIVKEGKLIWIGHPMALDTTLPKILDGSYDMAAYKIKFDKKAETYKKMFAANVAAFKPINDALAAKEYEMAYKLMEKLAAERPDMLSSVNQLKFTTLLKQGLGKEAIAFANQWQKEDKYAVTSIFIRIIEEDSLPKNTYLWAAKLFENSAPKMNPVTYHILASVYAKGGDYQKAVLNQEKAIEGAKAALKKGEMVGTIMDYTVTEYEDTLAGYKKAGKAAKNKRSGR